MKTQLIVIALAAVLAACGGKKTDKTAACTDAAEKAMQGMIGPIIASPQLPEAAKTEMKQKGETFKAVLVKHCTEDKWSDDVIDCYRKADSMQTMKACRTKLPPDQAGKLLSDEMSAMSGGGGMGMGGMGGMGGMSPHGGMGGPGMMGTAPAPAPAPAGSADTGSAAPAGSATGSGSAAH